MHLNTLNALSWFSERIYNDVNFIIAIIIFFCIATFIPYCVGKYAANKWNGNKRKTIAGFVLISLLITINLVSFFEFSLMSFQGYIFTLILLLASYSDIKTRECDDYLSVMILITAFIGVDLSDIMNMSIAGAFTAGIFLLVVLDVSDGIGGADIKLASASVFLLGFRRGIIGLVIGLLLAIIVNAIKRKKSGFPMIPYLTAAFIPAFFI